MPERRKVDRESARVEILRAWPGWADLNVTRRPGKDSDGHAFLRMIRSKQPELFTFKTNVSGNAHQTAFFWLLDAGFVAL